jgi:gliding motility-associated lipoprotein GldJ
MKKSQLILLLFLPSLLFLNSCSKQGAQRSSSTGWAYNDPKNGGFTRLNKVQSPQGPNLVLIEGGTFVMGQLQQDLGYDNDNYQRRVTVASFYMDQTEVRNIDWLEYLYYLQRVYRQYPQVYKKALPDTLCWRKSLAYNEPYVKYYLRSPSFQDYPVVGVTWEQAQDFCVWRTDRVNENILVSKGIQKENPTESGANSFNTDAYYAGQYDGLVKKNLQDLDPTKKGKTRPVRMQDGILLEGGYRLPTEAEWEYAALALKGNQDLENVAEKKIYPWNGLTTRSSKGKTMGLMLANFKRGRGDNMGVAGYLNDGGDVTTKVKSFPPNDFGLYDMAGNVNEWVEDVYRPMSFEDEEDFNPYRGNEYRKLVTDASGRPVKKDSLGHLITTLDSVNYKNPDLRGDRDDKSSFQYGKTSLIHDKSRVYKGGSWNDRAYWLTPGARRFMDQDKASAEVGFRCAMIRVGAPEIGRGQKPHFKQQGSR